MPGIDDDEDLTPNEENEESSENDEDDDDLPAEGETDPDGSHEEEAPATRTAARSDTADALNEQLMRRAIEAELKLGQAENNRSQQAEQERYNNMSDTERLQYDMQNLRATTANGMQQLAFQQQDLNDRQKFIGEIIAKNPKLAKYQDEVEKELTKMRTNKQNAPREAILDYVIGRATRQALTGGNGAKQKKNAQSNIQGARTKPTSSKGNVVSIKTKDKYAHLEKVYI